MALLSELVSLFLNKLPESHYVRTSSLVSTFDKHW